MKLFENILEKSKERRMYSYEKICELPSSLPPPKNTRKESAFDVFRELSSVEQDLH